MANQEQVLLRGKLKWVKHIRPDTAFEPHKWNLTLYPDEASLLKIKELKKEGMQNHLKLDEDGGQYMAFGRPCERTIKGRKQGMLPPNVRTKDGVPIEVPIGNGSDGVVELEVYRHKTQVIGQTKKAARWSGLIVDNLLEYKPANDDRDGGAETKALLEKAEPLWN